MAKPITTQGSTPPRIVRPRYQVPVIPPYRLPRRQTDPSGQLPPTTTNELVDGSLAENVKLQVAGKDEVIPILYGGPERIGGKIYTIRAGPPGPGGYWGSKYVLTGTAWIVVVYILCEGPVAEITDIKINDVDPPTVDDRGIQIWPYPAYFNVHLGAETVVDDILSYYTGAETWTETLEGYAYIVAAYPWTYYAYVTGFPQLTAKVKGRKVYDPRLDSTVHTGSGPHRQNNSATWEWSDNPALCLHDFLYSYCGKTVNADNTLLAATKADAYLPGSPTEKTSTMTLLLTSKQQVDTTVDVMRAYVPAWVRDDGATVSIIYDGPEAIPEHVFDSSNITQDPPPKLYVRGVRDVPAVVEIGYTNTSVEPWSTQYVSVGSGDTKTTIEMPGLRSYSSARRFATTRHNHYHFGNIDCEFGVFDYGVRVQIADVATVTEAAWDWSAQKVRITDVVDRGNGRWLIRARLYADSLYDTEIYSGSAPPDFIESLPALSSPLMKYDTDRRWTGIGTVPAAPLHVVEDISLCPPNEQVRIGFDASNYWRFMVGVSGGLTMYGVGTGGSLTLTPTAGQSVNLSLSGAGDFAVNTADLYVDTSTGYVGIGTTAPDSRFHIFSSTEQLRLANSVLSYWSFTVGVSGDLTLEGVGTTGSLTLTPTAGQNVSISLSTTGDFVVNTDDLYVDTSTGYVGIGATSPSAFLHVIGTTEQARFGYDTSNYWKVTVGSTGGLALAGVGTGGAITVTPTAGQSVNLSLSGAGDFVVNTNQFYVDTSTGYIGAGTTGPDASVHVVTAGAGVIPLRIEGTVAAGYSQLALKGTGRQFQVGVGNASEVAYGVANKFFIFDSTALVMRTVLDSSGYFGLGNVAPGVQFDQLSSTVAAGTPGTLEMIRIARPISGGVSYPQAASIALGTNATTGAGDGYLPHTRLDFKLKATGSDDYTTGVLVLSLLDDKNVGIGTTSFGTNAATVLAIATGTAPTTGPADTVQFYSSDDAAGHTIPSFYCEGTNVIATGQADSASSVRVKMRINGTVVTLLGI